MVYHKFWSKTFRSVSRPKHVVSCTVSTQE